MRQASRRVLRSVVAALLVAAGTSGSAMAGQPVVNVYNWGNSIGKNTNAEFEKATGITVRYQEFDSNDTLQAKLLAGDSGYDVVVPSNPYWARQVQAGIYQKLDKKLIPNLDLLDPKIMHLLAQDDPGNAYGVPWSWGTDGLGVNVQDVQRALGSKQPLDSLALLFDPALVSKLKGCGVSVLDSPIDVFGMALVYLHKNPNSTNPADYRAAYRLLTRIRPYITEFNVGSYINDLASNDICLALGWSGDVNVARQAAQSAHKPYHIRYVIPREGAPIWFDMMAVPADAPHPGNAMKYINFVLSAKQSADLTNTTSYPSAVPSAKPLIKPAELSDPAIYPSGAMFARLFVTKPLPTSIQRLETHLWLQLKAD